MRKVVFEADTLASIREFPGTARLRVGYELDRLQRDLEPENGKPFSSIGQGVLELRIQIGRQFRVIYVVKFAGYVHFLHLFDKKSQKTRDTDIAIAKQRLQEVMRRCWQ